MHDNIVHSESQIGGGHGGGVEEGGDVRSLGKVGDIGSKVPPSDMFIYF